MHIPTRDETEQRPTEFSRLVYGYAARLNIYLKKKRKNVSLSSLGRSLLVETGEKELSTLIVVHVLVQN